MLNLECLHSLVVFSEHLNLTHAARALNLTQPALHAQLQRLSDQLGAPLYTREGRRLSLTLEGERAVGFGRSLEAQIANFMDELHQRAERQPITLASGEGALRYLLGPAIRSFQDAAFAPLRLITARGAQAEQLVSSGRAQLAVTASDLIGDHVTSTLITHIGLALAMPHDHPLASHDVIELTDLEGTSLIVPPAGRPLRSTLEVSLSSAGVNWEVAVEAHGWDVSLNFVSLGIGLSVVNDFCVPPPEVILVPLRGLPSRAYSLLQRRGAPLSSVAVRLREMILESAGPMVKRGP